MIAGPGTEVTAAPKGPGRNLRIGVRGPALSSLRAEPGADRAIRPWLAGGIFRPRSSAATEWRRQQTILQCSRFAEHAAERGVHVEAAPDVAADEAAALLLDALRETGDGGGAVDAGPRSRQRLVREALAILGAGPDTPVSVARVCRRLQVGERTLQRAFLENLGIGLRAYERERRLGGAHGASSPKDGCAARPPLSVRKPRPRSRRRRPAARRAGDVKWIVPPCERRQMHDVQNARTCPPRVTRR